MVAMAWKECCIIDEKIKFIARVPDGEQVSDLCREFKGACELITFFAILMPNLQPGVLPFN